MATDNQDDTETTQPIEAAGNVTLPPADFVPTKVQDGGDEDIDDKNAISEDDLESMRAAAKAAGINTDETSDDAPPAKPAAAAKADESDDEEVEDNETATKEAEKKAADELAAAKLAKEQEEAAAAKAKPQDQAPATNRDDDLKQTLNPNTHPKTKKVIEEFKTKAVEARNERDRLAKELEEAKKSTANVPESVKTELETLRTRIREIDINQDPQIVEKYDNKIKANSDKIVGILKELGLGTTVKKEKDASGKDVEKIEDIPDYFDKLTKKGLNLKTLAPMLKALEDAGELEAADELKDLVRANKKLETERTTEVTDWKQNYETRKAAETAENEKKYNEYNNKLRADIDAGLVATLDSFKLKRPAAPAATDAPAVKAAKEEALKQWDAEKDVFLKTINKVAADPGETLKSAAIGTLVKDFVVPRLQKDLTTAQKRVAELEAELGKMRKAGNIRPTSNPKPADTKTKEAESAPVDMMDAIAQAAKNLGVNTDT